MNRFGTLQWRGGVSANPAWPYVYPNQTAATSPIVSTQDNQGGPITMDQQNLFIINNVYNTKTDVLLNGVDLADNITYPTQSLPLDVVIAMGIYQLYNSAYSQPITTDTFYQEMIMYPSSSIESEKTAISNNINSYFNIY